MFKGMRSRFWLTKIAQNELISRLAPVDSRTFGRLLRAFEQEQRDEGRWPCDSPDELAMRFSVWFDRRPESRTVGAVLEDARRAPKPWTPWQWHVVTGVAPDIVKRLFVISNVPTERAAQDPWMVGYSFGFVGPWLDTMPDEVLEKAQPELIRAYFDAVYGPGVGQRAFSFALKCFREGDDFASRGKNDGRLDAADVIEKNPSLNAARDVQAEHFWAHFQSPAQR